MSDVNKDINEIFEEDPESEEEILETSEEDNRTANISMQFGSDEELHELEHSPVQDKEEQSRYNLRKVKSIDYKKLHAEGFINC